MADSPHDEADQSRQTHEPERDERTGGSASAARIRYQSQWVEQQLRIAMERGEFDDLPGAGKPIEGLGAEHDPDWWVKRLVERERISVLPPALELRKEDAEMADRLDRLVTEDEVRREIDDFNDRVRRARMQLKGGPPVITPERDPEIEVVDWAERRRVRAAEQRAALKDRREAEPRRGLFRRRH